MNWPYELGASQSALQSDFDAVVRQFQRPLAQYLHRYVCQREAAIDLTQETFVKAYQNLHRYDPTRPFSTWIFSIASNLAKDRLRKTTRAAEVPYSELDDLGEAPCFQRPDRQLDASELGQALEAAIAALPLLYREPLVLRHTAGLSVEQTAEVLGTTAGVVKTRLFRARSRLQEALGKEWLPQ